MTLDKDHSDKLEGELRGKLPSSLLEAIEGHYESLETGPYLLNRVRKYFADSGISVSEFDSETNAIALSAWKDDTARIQVFPDIDRAGLGLTDFVLFHELFHLVSTVGAGLCANDHDLKEVLADRFATEMLYPLDKSVRCARKSADLFQKYGGPMSELLRATNRQAFVVNLPLGQENLGGNVTFQSPDALALRSKPSGDYWDELLAWTESGGRQSFFEHSSITASATFPNDSFAHTVNFITKEGIYSSHLVEKLVPMELFTSRFFDHVSENVGPPSYSVWELPHDLHLGRFILRAGRHLVITTNNQIYLGRNKPLLTVKCMLAIEDRDGSLASAWEEAKLRGESGPLLPPADPEILTHIRSFEDWVRYIERKFLGPASPTTIERIKRREAHATSVVAALSELEYDSWRAILLEVFSKSATEWKIMDILVGSVAESASMGSTTAKIVLNSLGGGDEDAVPAIEMEFLGIASKLRNVAQSLASNSVLQIDDSLTAISATPQMNVIVNSDAQYAFKVYNTLIEMGYGSPSAQVNRGLSHRALGNNESAIEDFTIAILGGLNDPYPLLCRAETYVLEKEYRKAILDATDAIKLDNDGAYAFALRGSAYFELGIYDLAISDLNRSLVRRQDTFLAHYELARVHTRLKQFDIAIEEYIKAIRLNPNAHCFHALGLAYAQKGENESAIECFSAAIEKNPSLDSVHYERGIVHMELGHFDEAIVDLTESLNRDPNDAFAYANIGTASLAIGEPQKAKEYLNEALRLDNDNPVPHYTLGAGVSRTG